VLEPLLFAVKATVTPQTHVALPALAKLYNPIINV
jgi:hypothetical protein